MKKFHLSNSIFTKRDKILIATAVSIVLLSSLVLPVFLGREARALDTGLEATRSAAQLPATGSITTVIGQIIYTILGFLGVIFVILVIYGGAMRMFAKGTPAKISESTGIITSAAIGIAIILASYTITAFVISQVGGNLGTTSDITTGTFQADTGQCNSGVSGDNYSCVSEPFSATNASLNYSCKGSLGDYGCPIDQLCCQSLNASGSTRLP